MNLANIGLKVKKQLSLLKYNTKEFQQLLDNECYDQVIDILECENKLNDDCLEILANAYYNNKMYRKACETFEKKENLSFNRIYLKSLSKATHYDKAAKLWNERYEEAVNSSVEFSKNDTIDAIIANYYIDDEIYMHYIKEIQENYPEYILWDSFAVEGAWKLAIYSLERYLEKVSNKETKLFYKTAKWYIQTFEYEKAKDYLLKCLDLERSNHVVILLSIVEERLGELDSARKLLESINISEHSNKVNLGYRLGNLHMQEENYEKAANIFYKFRHTNVITNTVILEDINFIAAEKFKESGDYDKAIESYLKVTRTYRGHFSPLYSLIGELLYLKQEYKQSCIYFKQYNVSDKFYGFDSKIMPKHSRVSYYVEQYENLPIDNDSILYCAYNGNAFYGNLLSLYQYYEKNPKMKHFIALKDMSTAPEELVDKDNVYVIQYESRLHYKMLATAKYIFTNGTYQFEYIRKPEQIALNTWHGTPIKRLGFDVSETSFSKSRNIINSYYTSTHIIHPNEQTKNEIINSFGLKNGNLHQVTGYPRQDTLINISMDRKLELKRKLNLQLDKPTVLYATTLRDGDEDRVKSCELIQDTVIETLNKGNDYNFIYKGHYSEDKNSQMNKVDPNELLSVVDILITDYSSIAIDYLVCKKPLVLFTHDIDDYRKERGFYFEPTLLTSNVAKTPEELPPLVEKLLMVDDIDKKQLDAKDFFCSYDDGKATSRVISVLKQQVEQNENKEKLLIFAGNIFLTNGITISFKNMIGNINFDKYEVFILLTNNSFEKEANEQILDSLRKKGCSFLFYYGAISATRIERYAYSEFNKNMFFYNEYHKTLYISAMKRTANRIFGNLVFDKILNFESGYSRDVCIMLSLMSATNKYLVLHSDMEKEQKLRFPHLKTTFNFWQCYDKILSVSDVISSVNYDSVGAKYMVEEQANSVLSNFLDTRTINDFGDDVLNTKEQKLFRFDKTFVCVGRLSVEKNHELVVEAFAQAKRKSKLDMNLVIIGEGPMYEKLQRTVRKLGMRKYIFILGFQDNPYKFIKNAHCLISPSLQEGQGLVMLEALALNVSLLATNIPASLEIVKRYGGEICELDSNDMSEKIIKIATRKNRPNSFDVSKYNQKIEDKLNELL